MQNYAYRLPNLTTVNGQLVYVLLARYVKNAQTMAADQLLKAGYRLAAVLNSALDPAAPAR